MVSDKARAAASALPRAPQPRNRRGRGLAVAGAFVVFLLGGPPRCASAAAAGAPSPRRGGILTIPEASAPLTFNPVFAQDNVSRLAASLTMADLMHINPVTEQVEPELALRVIHQTPLRWRIELRRGVRFSDGAPFTAADVVFSFDVYTDPKLAAPQRALLVFHGAPVRARALDAYTVELTLPSPDAVGDRLFDSLWMLPRHRLDAAFRAGRLSAAWGLATPPQELAGLGPFALRRYDPGRALVFARNPYYWRRDARDQPLPYLDQIRLGIVPDANLRTALFLRGQVDGLPSVRTEDLPLLAHRNGLRVLDAGPSLQPETLIFNLNEVAGNAALQHRQTWFARREFRQGVSAAIDRANLAANVYGGKAQGLDTLTSPAERGWADGRPAPARDDAAARRDFLAAGLHYRDGNLYDATGRPVAFSLIVPATNAQRQKIAVFIQEDLRRVGIAVAIVPLDFDTYVDRLLHRRDYDAALLGLSFPDADPNVEAAIWPLDGALHVWDLQPRQPREWERELDRLFARQRVALDPQRRRLIYRRIQAIEREELPLIPLVTPDVVVAVKSGLQGVEPGILAPHLLWNAATLHW